MVGRSIHFAVMRPPRYYLVLLAVARVARASEHMAAAFAEFADPNRPPPMCGYQPAADMGDDGPLLGMDVKKSSAADCCAACMAQAEEAERQAVDECKTSGRRQQCKRKKKRVACNSWTFCAEPLCWSPDIHNHSFGECRLRRQRDPFAAPKFNQRGFYSPAMRRAHPTAPPRVQWVSGVVGREGPPPDGDCDPGRFTSQRGEPSPVACHDEHRGLLQRARGGRAAAAG